MISLELPFPPSANNMFVNKPKRGRVSSDEYADWKKHAAWKIAAQNPGRIHGPVIIEYAIGWKLPPSSADLSNRVKALEDALVKGGVIDDDRFVESYSVRKDRFSSDVSILILPFAD